MSSEKAYMNENLLLFLRENHLALESDVKMSIVASSFKNMLFFSTFKNKQQTVSHVRKLLMLLWKSCGSVVTNVYFFTLCILSATTQHVNLVMFVTRACIFVRFKSSRRMKIKMFLMGNKRFYGRIICIGIIHIEILSPKKRG